MPSVGVGGAVDWLICGKTRLLKLSTIRRGDMTKTPEEMAEEWMNEEYGDTSHWVRMGKDMSIDAFLAGYQAATDKHLEQIRHLEMELQQAKLLAMKLEAER